MARTPSSKDGRPRVQASYTIAASSDDFITKTQNRLKKAFPKAGRGQAIDSLAEYAKSRRFDPVASLSKTMRPMRASTPAPAKSATPSGTKV